MKRKRKNKMLMSKMINIIGASKTPREAAKAIGALAKTKVIQLSIKTGPLELIDNVVRKKGYKPCKISHPDYVVATIGPWSCCRSSTEESKEAVGFSIVRHILGEARVRQLEAKR